MTRMACVVLDPTTVTVRLPGVAARTLPWAPAETSALRALVPTLVEAAASVRVVIGLGLLECASPELPPVNAEERRAIVWLDPARYLASDVPMAVTCLDRWVVGVSATHLAAWRQALAGCGTIDFVSAAAVVAHRGGTARTMVPAGEGEQAEVVVREGRVQTIRRAPAGTIGADLPSSARALIAMDSAALADAALAWPRPSPEALLLDRDTSRILASATQRRQWRTAALIVAAVVLAAVSAERVHIRLVARAVAEAQSQRQATLPARQAFDRLLAAQAEAALLQADVATHAQRDELLTVLAALTQRLPSDVVVQRLDWDGTRWRLDGTADRAPRLIPLLDADPAFHGIRIAEPSQRFLDAGRQRESFAFTWPGARSTDGGPRAR